MDSTNFFETLPKFISTKAHKWMLGEGDDSDFLPFYFNNSATKNYIMETLTTPIPTDDQGEPAQNIFILSKPSGIGKTAFTKSLTNKFEFFPSQSKTTIPPQDNTPKIYVVTVITPSPVPSFMDLINNTFYYYKKKGFPKQTLSISFDNITAENEEDEVSNIKNAKIELTASLTKNNIVLLFVMDGSPFGDHRWDDFSKDMKLLHRVGYIFASTNFVDKTQIGTQINTKNFDNYPRNFLELDYITSENIDLAFNYFFDFEKLTSRNKELLKFFIKPMLIGRPLFLFLFFRSIRDQIKDSQKTKPANGKNTDFNILIQQAFQSIIDDFTWRIRQSFESVKNEISSEHGNYADLIIKLFISPEKIEEYIGTTDNHSLILSKTPEKMKILQGMSLLYFEKIGNICRIPERFVIHCLKFHFSEISEKLRPTLNLDKLQKLKPILKSIKHNRNERGKLFEMIICYLLCDRTTLFHHAVVESMIASIPDSPLQISDIIEGEFTSLTQEQLNSKLTNQQTPGVFIVQDNVSGEGEKKVEKFDILFSLQNKHDSRVYFCTIQATTQMKAKQKFLDFCTRLSNQQKNCLILQHFFISLFSIPDDSFSVDDTKIIEKTTLSQPLSLFDSEMEFFLLAEFPTINKRVFGELARKGGDAIVDKIIETLMGGRKRKMDNFGIDSSSDGPDAKKRKLCMKMK